MLLCPGPVAHGMAPLADLRFEDLLVGFERLRGFEVVDFPPALLEPLVEGVLRGGELLQGRAWIVALPVDDRHIPLGQALEPHLSSRMPSRLRDASYSLRRECWISSKMALASSR